MDSNNYAYNNNNNSYTYLYYSNSNAKSVLDSWYNTNIGSNSTYSSLVATGNYFCEAAKVRISTSFTANSASPALSESYIPDLKCQTDGNGKGLVNASIGMFTYDEAVLAGAHSSNSKDYLTDTNTSYWWLMTPNGMASSSSGSNGFGGAVVWYVRPSGSLAADWNVNSVLSQYDAFKLRPVINLKANVTFTGSGTEQDPYVITGLSNDNGTEWVYCGKDYDTCTLSDGSYNVKYGKDDTWIYKSFNGTFVCQPTSFDNTDPLPGVVKGCYYQVASTSNNSGNSSSNGDWKYCIGEGGSYTLPSGSHEVKYGLEDSWYYKTLSGTFTCNSTTFGGDPIYGKAKECYYK